MRVTTALFTVKEYVQLPEEETMRIEEPDLLPGFRVLADRFFEGI
jgi:hypothetical protein